MKVFEDYFMEIQADMVSICLEYVENAADMIYIYVSCEGRMISCDYFYKIDNAYWHRYQLNKIKSKDYDISVDRQKACLNILIDDAKQLISICKQFEKPMPTEIKLIYDIKNNSLDTNYKYDAVYSKLKNISPDDIFEEWFESFV